MTHDQNPSPNKTNPDSDDLGAHQGTREATGHTGPAKPKRWKTIMLVAAAIVSGYWLRGTPQPIPARAAQEETGSEEAKKPTIWTCSMHPQIRLPKPGKCPICGMTLIPLEEGSDSGPEEGPRELRMSETARLLSEILTAPVERRQVEVQVRMVGKLDYDETRTGTITSWVPGRLDRLYVDYTGVPVKKGDHMVYLYSPELLSAQEELLQAVKTAKELEGSRVSIARESAEATVEASRDKLRLWGLTKRQIANIEKRGKTTDHLTIYAPMGGIVIHKTALEGMYVQTGTKIYTIADLSHLWLKLDAYESDMAWIRYGQKVEFTTEAYPGEVFEGRISFIDPILNEKTRTVKLRVNVENPNGRLKPGMFARAVVKARVSGKNVVIDSALAGKWLGRMHPEIVRDKPGRCPVCGMPLVKAETLGFAKETDAEAAAPLVIPVTAPLITGLRAVVYVEIPDRKQPTYEGREVVLGPRAGDYYVVKSGLEEGEQVVVSGNFKIDSAIQIAAKPSMMSPEGGMAPSGHNHGSSGDRAGAKKTTGTKGKASPSPRAVPKGFQKALGAVYERYLEVHKALATDDEPGAKKATEQLLATLEKVPMKLLAGADHMAWMPHSTEIKESARQLQAASGLKDQRNGFALLSESLASALDDFGFQDAKEAYKMKCPMVFQGRGAIWLQSETKVANPYYGTAMPGCGSKIAEIGKSSE